MKASARPGQSAAVRTLPTYLTSFVGRAGDLDGLKPLLRDSRLVTLTGPGGAGKTRLAAEVGRACGDLWPGGVWWVELAPVSDPAQMPNAVVAALGLPGRGQARDVVAAWLAPRQALLVLDNCEHLVAVCAGFCQGMLERCPDLSILATSREALGVAGEAQWPVSSLAVTESIELFGARARLVLPDFKVVASNLGTVTQICERLDGMPLAIELAAARVGMMAEEEILSQLRDRFRLLTGGSRTAPARLQALSAAIDWSYRLLTEDEAALFRRLSVFRGGFTLESAEAVCALGTTASVLDLIAGLVQKSMVVAERTEGLGSRYRLLESQIAYAEYRLKEAGESEAMHRRHYEYFTDSLSVNMPFSTYPTSAGFHDNFGDFGGSEAGWVARESSNVWSAVMWARNHADDLGLSLAAHLPRVKFGDLAQLRSLLEELLGHSPATGLARVQALNGAAMAAYKQGDYDAAISLAGAELTLARDMGDLVGTVQGIHWLASAYEGRGEFDVAAEMFDEAMTLLEGSSNHRLLNLVRNAKADLEVQRGNYASAEQLLADCLKTARAEGDFGRTGTSLETLGWVQRGMGEHQAAAASWRESLSIARRLTHQLLTVDCLEGLLCAAEAAGDYRRAVCLGAAANRMAHEMSYNVDPWWLREYEESLARSRARLGPRASEEAWNEGWSMSVDQAVDYALAGEESATVVEVGRLSRRQKEVAQLVAAGRTNREIADRLFISERTAEGHVDQIRNKLGVRSRTEIASWAVEHGLASGPKIPERHDMKARGTRRDSPSAGRVRRA